jgi:prepilin-type N-terminal cleavage/methylation domain-containing protein
MTPLRRTTPARARRGFTILEMVVVMVVLGLLLAVALPRVSSGAVFAQDQLAKASANAALDAAVHHYLHVGRGDGTDCTVQEDPEGQPAPAAIGDAVDGLALSDADQMAPAGEPLPAGEDGPPTSCPVFVNPHNLGRDAGEITYLPGNQASTGGEEVSIAGRRTGGAWRVAVASLSVAKLPLTSGEVRTCWAAVRDLPDGGDGTSRERYFATRVPDGENGCTANAFLGRRAVVDAIYTDDPSADYEPCTRAFLEEQASGGTTNVGTDNPGAQVLKALAGCTWRYPSP